MFNKFIVANAGYQGEDSIVIFNPAPLRNRTSKEDALNLIAWVKVLANISDEELKEAERQILND